MTDIERLILGVEALRMCYPNFRLGNWSRSEIREEFHEQETLQVAKRKAPKLYDSDDEPPSGHRESVDRYVDGDREAPYGMIGKERMIQAIIEGDLDIIDESPIGANVALFTIDQEAEAAGLKPDVNPEIREYIEFNVSESPYRRRNKRELLTEKLAVLRA